MATAMIELRIHTPTHRRAFEGNATVRFRGRVMLPKSLAANPPRLYYRWYSSLDPATAPGRYAITQPALDAADPSPAFKQLMPLGSQVITFAVSDQATETDDSFKAMQHGAVAGGALGTHACVIHVFRATILAPRVGQTVSAAGLVLKAQAPWAWESADYQIINRLAYRWSIVPADASSVHPSFVSPKLCKDDMEFDETDQSVSYKPALPPHPPHPKFEGAYEIKLEVLDCLTPEIGQHTVGVAVAFT